MNTYSHLVIAEDVQSQIQQHGNIQEYLWGAIAPDVRYVAGMRRNQTHLSREQISRYMAQYPAAKAFLHGYLVHCLTDEMDLASIMEKKFPFYLLKKKLSAQHYPVILETYYLENKVIRATSISGKCNPVLADLGITDEQSQSYGKLVSEYMATPSFDTALTLAQKLGIVNKDRIDRYLASAKRFRDSRTMKSLMFVGIRIGKIHDQLTKAVLSAISLSSSKES